MRISDLKGVFKKWQVEFISAENISGDYWIVKLKPQDDMSWNPGEHAVFTIPGKKIKGRKWRAFSIASVLRENVIIIGTRTGNKTSSFKETLFGLEKGGKVKLRGPFGWYRLRGDEEQIVMVATGVGITPDRALSLEITDKQGMAAELVHSAHHHLFREELETLSQENPEFKVHYAVGRDDAKAETKRLAVKHANNAKYYISGSIKVIRSIARLLKKIGIKGKNIIRDPFIGY